MFVLLEDLELRHNSKQFMTTTPTHLHPRPHSVLRYLHTRSQATDPSSHQRQQPSYITIPSPSKCKMPQFSRLLETSPPLRNRLIPTPKAPSPSNPPEPERQSNTRCWSKRRSTTRHVGKLQASPNQEPFISPCRCPLQCGVGHPQKIGWAISFRIGPILELDCTSPLLLLTTHSVLCLLLWAGPKSGADRN
jgi:hypothetical protein